MEKSRRIITLTVACFCFWFWLSAEGRSGCREPQQLQRDCRAVCGKNRLGAVSCELRVAVLLPADSRFDISLLKVLPVLDLAVYEARSRGLLPYWLKLKFFPQDDQCDAMYAQIGAIHSYSNCVHLFLGPACDYCVAVVGRVVKFFGAPLITTGGFTFDFTEKKTEFSDEYFMTTRVGKLAFRDLAQFLVALMNRYSWRKVNLVYATNGQSRLAGRHTCQLMMKSMVEFIRKQQNFTYGTFDVEATTLGDYPEAMRDHVGNWYGDAFLGPVCDYAIAPVARYAGVWGIPVLTAGGQAEAFRYKAEHYPTLVRMMGSHRLVGEALRHILGRFGWKIAGLIFHNHPMASSRGNSECHFTLGAVFTALDQTPTYKSFDQEITATEDYRKLLAFLSRSARIIVMCANSTTIREILLAAEELGMVDSGEYVFFSIDLTSSDNDSKEPWKVEGDTDERNEKARKAYQALLTVTARTPDNLEYLNFSREVKSLAQSKYNFTFGSSSVSTFVTAFYDAVLLYALALKESLPEQPGPGEVNLDGGNLTRRMWGRTFKGITGDVNIDENGDRIADYSLLDMDPETSKFQIVAHYYGANKTLEYVPGKRIHWSGGRTEPPPDTPTCGFDGSLCPDNSLPGYAILSIVLSSIVVALLVASVFIYRHFKLEADIASMTWKVHWEDITVMAHAKTRGSVYSLIVNKLRGSQLTIYSDDNMSLPDGADRHVYIPTGIYKNSKVAIKSIPRKKVEISRPLLLELKRMKDLQHDHLVRFYGACLEPPHCCLLTEYCPKGSLQDILENEQFKLDRVFRFSLIHDIVRGMAYLHASEVRSHGNLKSSNCVVDSRFVLKIADFGLHELRSPCPGRTNVDLDPDPEDNGDVDENSYAYWKKQLWTAPELLRMERRPAEGTQKGDVYSFAIIVHEIVVRQGPFYLGVCLDFSPKGAGKRKRETEGESEKRGRREAAMTERSGSWTASNLTLPAMPGASPEGGASPRRAVSPLLEVRRPHCTLNCESCNAFLEDVYRHKIVEGVKRGGGSPMRPAIDEATVEEEVANLMRRCWAQDAADRPDFPALKQTIRKINKDYESSNILDNLLSRMEQYATNLETLVEERTTDYFEEKRKCEELLYQLLPKSVASQLILGQSVIAETYDQVTIYFSDIVGFTSLSAESTPLQVVDLLNDLYTCFDSIIEHFDVYKVETIGDAYMVVSGLPVRNGTNHAREIARMSLALRDTVMTFRIRHRPNEQLKLRIGMHSGPCVAGVVGLKMPRYCLFGDTVNTASRMESNGEALKIHVSPKTKEILDTFGTFDLVCRGEVTLKGKGRMTTYWLLGEKSTCDEICRVPVSSATETPATGTGIATSTATVTATAASTVTTTATTTARTNATTTSMTSSGRTTSSATLTTITIAAAPVSRSNAGNESTATRTTSATATTVTTVTTVTTATTTVAVRPVAKACSRIGAIEQREEENVRSRNPERPSNRLSSQRLMDQERQQPRPIQRRIRYHRRQTSSPSRRIGDDADDKNKGADNDVNNDDDDDDDDDNDDDDDDSEGVSGDGGESENVAVSPSQRSRRTSERLPNHAETSPNSPFLVATRSTGTVPRV